MVSRFATSHEQDADEIRDQAVSEFAIKATHPDLLPRTYSLGEQVTVHYVTYEHLVHL